MTQYFAVHINVFFSLEWTCSNLSFSCEIPPVFILITLIIFDDQHHLFTILNVSYLPSVVQRPQCFTEAGSEPNQRDESILVLKTGSCCCTFIIPDDIFLSAVSLNSVNIWRVGSVLWLQIKHGGNETRDKTVFVSTQIHRTWYIQYTVCTCMYCVYCTVYKYHPILYIHTVSLRDCQTESESSALNMRASC